MRRLVGIALLLILCFELWVLLTPTPAGRSLPTFRRPSRAFLKTVTAGISLNGISVGQRFTNLKSNLIQEVEVNEDKERNKNYLIDLISGAGLKIVVDKSGVISGVFTISKATLMFNGVPICSQGETVSSLDGLTWTREDTLNKSLIVFRAPGGVTLSVTGNPNISDMELLGGASEDGLQIR